MQAVVLDTDVFSFFFKNDTRAALYAPDLSDRQLCLCFQTIAELRAWAIERTWGPRQRERLSQVLRHYVVLPYDSAMANHWASVTVQRKQASRTIACGDAWIAAAALRHDLPLLTHNGQDLVGIPGLRLITHAGSVS